jgi:hypothetical protein
LTTPTSGVLVRIEFKREGHAKVTITISREPHSKQTSRSSEAGSVVLALYRRACPTGSGPTW